MPHILGDMLSNHKLLTVPVYKQLKDKNCATIFVAIIQHKLIEKATIQRKQSKSLYKHWEMYMVDE